MMMDSDAADLTEVGFSSSMVLDGVILKVYDDRVRLPDGKETIREYIKHNGAVSIAAVTDDGRIAVVRQFRYPFGRVFLEIPAGKLDSPDEDPMSAAARELREETGITADEYTFLGALVPCCAYTTERVYMYKATGLHMGEQDLDETEFLKAGFMPLKELYEMALRGEIEDSKTLVSVLRIMAGDG